MRKGDTVYVVVAEISEHETFYRIVGMFSMKRTATEYCEELNEHATFAGAYKVIRWNVD